MTQAPTPRELAPLRISRVSRAALQALPESVPPARWLGALSYGPAPDPSEDWLHPLPASPLLNTTGLSDVWMASGPARSGQTARLRWRATPDWLFGAIDLDAGDEAEGVEALAYRAYADLFATLAEHGQPRLLRLWNYLPHITGDGGGMERYRQFNSGRQRAFLDAGQAAFEGAPAACALGLRSGGGLSLRFIAGRTSVRAIENPRQTPAWRYPKDYGPRAPTFSRAALAALGAGQLALLVSGTASIVGHASQHAGDISAQVAETLRNLHAVFDAARAQCNAPFFLESSEPVVYIRHAAQASAIRDQLAQALGPQSHFMRSAVFLEADICRPELDVEIETQACEPGVLKPSGQPDSRGPSDDRSTP